MTSVEAKALVKAPLRRVFNLSQDYGLRLAWDPFLNHMKLLGGAKAQGVGVRTWVRSRWGLDMEVECLSYAPPRLVAVKMLRGPWMFSNFAGVWRFAKAGKGRCEAAFQYGFETRFRLLEPLVRAVFARDVRARVEGLKAYAEEPSLYRRVLGRAWKGLHPRLRRFHGEGALRAEGKVDVERGGLPAKALAWMMRLPAQGKEVALRLEVQQRAGGEVWRRDFGGRGLASAQWAGADGTLWEKAGPLRLQLELKVLRGMLSYESKAARLRLGLLDLPLPRWLAPRVSALEKAGPGGKVMAEVSVEMPLLGRLIRYGGSLS